MHRGPRAVLLYHRVATPRSDAFGLAVSPEQFAEHLEVLRSRATMVSLDDLLRADARDDAPLAAVTFDDGYQDNLTTAAPLLVEAGIPATFFVSTGALGDPRGFWWDRLASAVAATDLGSGELGAVIRDVLGGAQRIEPTIDLTGRDARARAAVELAALLRPRPSDERDRLLEALEARLPEGGGGTRESHPIVDADGLAELAATPRMTIGAHTYRHPVLAGLPADAQRDEIVRGAAVIREITGTLPELFAYPYGSEHDYDEVSIRAARRSGMRAAFVNHGGRFDPKRAPFRIPRHHVPPLPPDELCRWFETVMVS